MFDGFGTAKAEQRYRELIRQGGHLTTDKLKEAMMAAEKPNPKGFPEGNYDVLWNVLERAFYQSATGKGNERHAQGGLPFQEQPIMQIGRSVGHGFNTGQAVKKLIEAGGMLARGQKGAAIAEVLGAIVYAASVVALWDEKED